MDKFKFGVFDVLVYTLPGFIVFSSLYLVCNKIDPTVAFTFNSVLATINTLTFNFFLIICIISYILGFVLHFFGYLYFNLVGKNLWKKSLERKEDSLSNIENKYVIVRQYSKENFVYVELWNAFRGMSFNLSLAFVLLDLTIFTKLIEFRYLNFDWIILIMSLLIISIVLLRRAVTFHIWSHNTINESIDVLRLKDQALPFKK